MRRYEAGNQLLGWQSGRRIRGLVFMKDVGERLTNRVQMTTDGHKAYLDAVEDVFGANIDYAMLVKIWRSGRCYGPLQPGRMRWCGEAPS